MAGNILGYRSTGLRSLLPLCCLIGTWIVGFGIRLFSVIRYESIIHEYDPWFNYRSTRYMAEKGFYPFNNWFDERSWYPLGRIVGGTVFPGLMITSTLLHKCLHYIGLPIHIREICVFLAPVFSGCTACATFLLTKELWNLESGLFSALFIAVTPGYLSRSVAGSYDNEGIAIFALMFTFWLWLRSLRTGSMASACFTALSYMYMVSAWGGYVFIINLIPLHVAVLMLMGKYSERLYVAYSTFYVCGTLMSMQIPFVGFQSVRTSEHMAALGVFGLLQIYFFVSAIIARNRNYKKLMIYAFLCIVAISVVSLMLLTSTGFIAPWSGRFYSLWNTGYAKIHIPIITSVSEHQPTAWTAFYFDLHILICLFPAGVWFTVRDINEQRVFIVLYAVFASYFAGVMVRLMLTLTPVVCVISGYTVSRLVTAYAKNNVDDENSKRVSNASATDEEDDSVVADGTLRLMIFVAILSVVALFFFHCTWISSNAYSSPSIILAGGNNGDIIDDYREAYFWLQQNTKDDARIMSWWDYGYQITGMGNRTTLVDNNTWNNTHIAIVGKTMSLPEAKGIATMRDLDVDYVLVIFGGLIGYSGDDINKFLWMVRIGGGEFPKELKESDYFTDRGEFRVDRGGAPALLNSLMYSLCYYRFGETQRHPQLPAGFDVLRRAEIGRKNIKLEYLEEAFTSENWIVRIYKVNRDQNRKTAKKHLRSLYSSRKTTQKAKLGKPGIISM
ncbi:hypothetical protein GJ496_006814 [Pomphorhynchus laevis]|nr:hypothetical protein GJ496_006814 [Pomphorhynchus laevis]